MQNTSNSLISSYAARAFAQRGSTPLRCVLQDHYNLNLRSYSLYDDMALEHGTLCRQLILILSTSL